MAVSAILSFSCEHLFLKQAFIDLQYCISPTPKPYADWWDFACSPFPNITFITDHNGPSGLQFYTLCQVWYKLNFLVVHAEQPTFFFFWSFYLQKGRIGPNHMYFIYILYIYIWTRTVNLNKAIRHFPTTSLVIYTDHSCQWFCFALQTILMDTALFLS